MNSKLLILLTILVSKLQEAQSTASISGKAITLGEGLHALLGAVEAANLSDFPIFIQDRHENV